MGALEVSKIELQWSLALSLLEEEKGSNLAIDSYSECKALDFISTCHYHIYCMGIFIKLNMVSLYEETWNTGKGTWLAMLLYTLNARALS